ncbi:hypothetical protein E4U55_003590 [Claviceps digitariae]|nr:hypothetical protein E4U55_003590 [Claviceps digitariae]
MDTSRLVPHDPRVREETAEIRGKTYTYLIGEPAHPTETVFLIHGFPDLAFGWRCQMPFLMSMGFRVVAPNMMGYAGTSRPEDLAQWSFKSIADDIKALAGHVMGGGGGGGGGGDADGQGGEAGGKQQIILGGHDWGGAVVWRVALWHPGLIKAVFSVCTPFQAPSTRWMSLEEHLAAGRFAHFRYQLQLAGRDVEARLQTAEQVRRFLQGAYGGRGPGGEAGFTVSEGVRFEQLPRLGSPPSLSRPELDHYVEQYMRQAGPPLRGPLNWYRTRRINHDDEMQLAASFAQGARLDMPALFIAATEDAALPLSMSAGMEKYFARLTRGEVQATHWALVEASELVNAQIAAWLAGVLPEGAIRAVL